MSAAFALLASFSRRFRCDCHFESTGIGEPAGHADEIRMEMRHHDALHGPPCEFAFEQVAPDAFTVSTGKPRVYQRDAVVIIEHPEIDMVEIKGGGMRSQVMSGAMGCKMPCSGGAATI